MGRGRRGGREKVGDKTWRKEEKEQKNIHETHESVRICKRAPVAESHTSRTMVESTYIYINLFTH